MMRLQQLQEGKFL